jgi:hypothetical protein
MHNAFQLLFCKKRKEGEKKIFFFLTALFVPSLCGSQDSAVVNGIKNDTKNKDDNMY